MLVVVSTRTIQRGVMANIVMSLLSNIEQIRTTGLAYTSSDFQDQREVVSIFAVRPGCRVGVRAARNRRRRDPCGCHGGSF